ncbi:hypothetical protein [Curtobacterium sp. MCSS17_016]|uniref:hypothetical protein n=1 Tax=Curtobacterium sp. MCSS17_016 TaxID=2175644 RepID=UPI000DA99186|nr:hypothetical protein [Curtobacterium sp. MCSS17_016]WIE80857.1 hypothetical protein DEJ19_020285 [Curtobacterium sp. MCSS17_016]
MTSVVVSPGEDITTHLSESDRWVVAVTNPTSKVTVLADSLTDVVADMVDDYDPSDPAKAFEQRLDYVVRSTAFQQAIVAAAAVEDGTLDIDTVGEDALTALFSDRTEAAEVTEWNHSVPLLHVSSHYEPYTERPRPSGNVHLLDPYTELTLLQSLHAAGSLEVLFRDVIADNDAEDFAA